MANGYLLIDDHLDYDDDRYIIGVFKTEEAMMKYVAETYLEHIKPEFIIISEDREICIKHKGTEDEYTQFKYIVVTVF